MYEVDLPQESGKSINVSSPWKLDEWIAVEYGNMWVVPCPGIVAGASSLG